MARGVMGRVNDEALIEKLSGLDAQQRAEARAQHGKAASVSWRSAGSHKDDSNIWRGGVAVCSYDEAALRESSVISDASGWKRYCGRVCQGNGGRGWLWLWCTSLTRLTTRATQRAAITRRGWGNARLQWARA